MEKQGLPLVSLAIITYNQKDYLRECIESVLSQDYENIEIVIADDCSTDGTQDMLREYDKKYPNKFVLKLSERNQGITANSNLALFACCGKYIAMTGGDDIFLPTNYSLSELIASGNGLVSVVSYMFRKDAAPKKGFDFRLPTASDSLFYFHIANQGSIWIIPEYLTSYRIHKSHASKLEYRDDILLSLSLCEYYFSSCLNSIKIAKCNFFYSLGRFYNTVKILKNLHCIINILLFME
jgi:glycosyltransferase involved in cell wall biosynthesis